MSEHAIWSFGLSYVVLFGSSMECSLFAPRSPFLCPTRRVIEDGFVGLTCFCVHPIPPTLTDLNAFGILMPLWLYILCPLCLLFDVLNWNTFFWGERYFITFIVSLLLLRWSSWRHLPVGYFSCFSTRHRELTPEDYEFLGCIGGWPSMACFHRGPLELRKLCKLDEAVPKRNTLEEGKAASLW